MTDVKLPPLPEAAILQAHGLANAFAYGFHANQMTEYARLAVLQEREKWQKDAERYRWLRDVPWLDTPIEKVISMQQNKLWDSAIDDAIRKGE